MTSKGRTFIYALIACVCCIISYTDGAICGGAAIGDCALCGNQAVCDAFLAPAGDFLRGCYWGGGGGGRCVPICECTECDGFSAGGTCDGTGQNYCSCNLNPGATGCCGMDILGGDVTVGSCTFRAGNCEATATPDPTTASPTTASPTTAGPTTGGPMTSKPTTAGPTDYWSDSASSSYEEYWSDTASSSDEESDEENHKKNTYRRRKKKNKKTSDSASSDSLRKKDDGSSDSFDAALSKESNFLLQNNGKMDDHPTNMTLTLSAFTVVCLFGVFMIVNVCILAMYYVYNVSPTKYEIDL